VLSIICDYYSLKLQSYTNVPIHQFLPLQLADVFTTTAGVVFIIM